MPLRGRNTMKKKILLLLSILFILSALIPSALADSAGGDISPAIALLRKETALNKCGVFEETISFSRADFENILKAELKYITVTALPDASKGVLKLNGVPVVNGQTIASSSLNYFTFIPATGISAASFTFRCDVPGWEYNDIPCRIRLFANRNTPPVLPPGSLSAVRNAKTEYMLNLYEPDGDNVKLYVDKYPSSGSISIKDEVLVYTPVKGLTGKDEMAVRVVDEYGNSSAVTVIGINVRKSSIVFSDMAASSAHAAAIALAENSIVTYTYKNGEYLYNPNLNVSRIDFLVMLMAAADVKAEGIDTNLSFTDTSNLNAGRKQYLAKAVAMKLVDGSENTFRPNEGIVRREAALWVAKLLGLNGKAAVIKDISGLDLESSSGITAAVDAGIFTLKDGMFYPEEAITREEAARILFRVTES